jgi:hypothetical protein
MSAEPEQPAEDIASLYRRAFAEYVARAVEHAPG